MDKQLQAKDTHLTNKNSALESKISELDSELTRLKTKVLNVILGYFSKTVLLTYVNFQIEPKTTTQQVDQNLPSGCSSFKTLTRIERKATSATVSLTCDSMKSSNKSPDWYGTGWYKISENIGSKIAENPPSVNHCGTAAPAWIQYGGHPTKLGETNESVRVCFVWGGNNCHNSVLIKIRNCGNYFLYYLPDYNGCTGYCVI